MPTIRFDEDIAATYDEDSADRFDPDLLATTADFLAEQAGDGRALELAIGTGRVAVPLVARGVPVAGIELSPYMLARLRAKPEAAGIEVVEGDMTTDAGGRRVLARLPRLQHDHQPHLAERAGRLLRERRSAPGDPAAGFVVEVFLPILQKLPLGERFHVFAEEPGYHAFDEYDVVNQVEWSHHLRLREDGTYRRFSAPYRYVWPAELDLMARIAGLELVERWADWDRTPFMAESEQHVSVWAKRA